MISVLKSFQSCELVLQYQFDQLKFKMYKFIQILLLLNADLLIVLVLVHLPKVFNQTTQSHPIFDWNGESHLLSFFLSQLKSQYFYLLLMQVYFFNLLTKKCIICVIIFMA